MIHSSVETCQTVLDMNAALDSLIYQLFKRGITFEEFAVAYEYSRQQAIKMGLKYYPEWRTYGPEKIGPIEDILKGIKYARFINQFNQAAEYLNVEHNSDRMTSQQYHMCWTLLMAQADFQDYEWNKFKQRFFES